MLKVRSSWPLLATIALLTAAFGCGKGPTTPGGTTGAEREPGQVGQGLTNVLTSALGANPAGSSVFFKAPNDPAILLAPGPKDYAAAADSNMPQWLAFDLGAVRKVEAVSITWWSEADRGLNFTVQGRKDSRAGWEALATVTDNSGAVWSQEIRVAEIGQVRLEVTQATGQGRTLIKKLQFFAAEGAPVKNVALVSAGLKVDSSSAFFKAPNDPAAMFTGKLSAPNSNAYAAGQADGLPDFVEFSLPSAAEVMAVGVHWYDDQNYAIEWALEAKDGDLWKPVLTVTDGKEVHGFYLLDKPVTAQTFRLTVTKTAGQQRMLARQLALYAAQ